MIAPDQLVLFILYAMAIIGLLLVAIVIYISGQLRFKLRMHQQTNRLLTALTEEQERILNEVSVEIHDNVVQLTNFSLMTLKGSLGAAHKAQADSMVKDAIELLEEVNMALRTLSHSLNGEYVKQHGLLSMVERELECLCKSGRIHCHFNLFGTPLTLGEEQELVLYRIAQEAIHNAIKHARASAISVELTYAPGQMMMTISDDGVGFEQSNAAMKGLGLANMKHRAALIGASLQIHSALNSGTRVLLTMMIKS